MTDLLIGQNLTASQCQQLKQRQDATAAMLRWTRVPLNNLLLEDAWKTNKHGLLPSLFTHRIKIVGAGSTESCGGEEVGAACDFSQRIVVQGLPAPTRRRTAW